MSRNPVVTCLLLLLSTVAGSSVAVAEDLSGYSGAQLFQRFCVSCHGTRGEGDGTVAPFFKLTPPDLTQLSRRSSGQFPAERVRKIIDGRENPLPHGSREMPVWGMVLTPTAGDKPDGQKQAAASIQLLVEYLRTIQAK
jgi:mono/diheme cytochrome c family protein